MEHPFQNLFRILRTAASGAVEWSSRADRPGESRRIGSVAGRIGVALFLLFLASAFRWIFLESLGTRLIWLTFYPGVMVAAVAAGWISGTVVVVGTVAIALRGGSIFGVPTFVQDRADVLGLWVFVGSATLMIVVAEMSRRARVAAWKDMRLAEQADLAKTRFLASMSHEMRTPLNAILGFSRILERSNAADPSTAEHARIVHRSAEHLLGVIDGILEHARATSGKIELASRPFDIDRLVREVGVAFEGLCAQKGLRLEVAGTRRPGRAVAGDEGKIRQILFNLLGNATKFTDAGIVRMELAEASTGRFRFAVRDTGRGVPPEDESRLFLPFERGKTAENSAVGGTGLGLSISREFARRMGGDIRFSRPEGRGSIFELEVALPRSDQPVGAEDSIPSWKLAPDAPRLAVLVVDDNADNRHLLRRLLDDTGFGTEEAADGTSALAALERIPFQVVVTDLLMPGMDGIELARRIRSRHPKDSLALLGWSASANMEDRDGFLVAGGDTCLSKPLLEEELFEALARHAGAKFDALPVSGSGEDVPGFAGVPLPWRREFQRRLDDGDVRAAGSCADRLPPHLEELAAWIRRRAREYDLGALQALARKLSLEEVL